MSHLTKWYDAALIRHIASLEQVELSARAEVAIRRDGGLYASTLDPVLDSGLLARLAREYARASRK